MKDFFISYSGNDRDWAVWLAWVLEDAGYKVIIQEWDFGSRGVFVERMDQALSQSTAIIALLSPSFIESDYCMAEWRAGFNQDPSGTNGTLIQFRVKQCNLKPLMNQRVYTDLFGLKRDKAKDVVLSAVASERKKPDFEPPFAGASTMEDSAVRRLREPPFPGRPPLMVNVPPSAGDRIPAHQRSILDAIADNFDSGRPEKRVQVLVGETGMAETRIAQAFAYRRIADYEVVWWIVAVDEGLLEADYCSLAATLDLIESEEEEDCSKAVKLVRDWLAKHDGWLLVFRDIPDTAALKKYLPDKLKGHVLVTTRNPAWEGYGSIIRIPSKPPKPTKDSSNKLEERPGQVEGEYRRIRMMLVIMVVDVVDSTDKLNKLGTEKYLEKLHRLLNELSGIVRMKKYDGRVLKQLGDGLLVVFRKAWPAVECALAIQEQRSQRKEFTVRVGIDMGTVMVTSYNKKIMDVGGEAVNKAFRIEPLGDAGHVLTSSTIAREVRQWLKMPSLQWKDHGRFRLKGLKEPERIWEPYFANFTEPLPDLRGDRVLPGDEFVPCVICHKYVRFKETRTCKKCNKESVCTECFDSNNSVCAECLDGKLELVNGPNQVTVEMLVPELRAVLSELKQTQPNSSTWVPNFEKACSLILKIMDLDGEPPTECPEWVASISNLAQRTRPVLSSEFRQIVSDRLHRLFARMDWGPFAVIGVPNGFQEETTSGIAEDLFSGSLDLDLPLATEYLLSNDELHQAAAIHWLLKDGYIRARENLNEISRLGNLEKSVYVLWRCFPRVLLHYDTQVFSELCKFMIEHDSDSWKSKILDVGRLLRFATNRDYAIEVLSKYSGDDEQVVAAFLALNRDMDSRQMGMDYLNLANRWEFFYSSKTPMNYLRELVDNTIQKALGQDTLEHNTDHYVKTLLLAIKERLSAVEKPSHLEHAYAILRAFYRHPALLEQSFFDVLFELHTQLRNKVQKTPELENLEEVMAQEFEELVPELPFDDAAITELNDVPLPVQRKLARDGFLPEVFICNMRDAIALETIPHVKNRADAGSLLLLPYINKEALHSLAREERLIRNQANMEAFCKHPRARPASLRAMIPRLSLPQLKKLAKDHTASEFARKTAKEVLKRKGQTSR
jgi:class 3 adenylate cyclase